MTKVDRQVWFWRIALASGPLVVLIIVKLLQWGFA